MSLEGNANRPEDREIDELLRAYFASEIPERLPPLPVAPPGLPGDRSVHRRGRTAYAEWLAYTVLAATVAVVLAARFSNLPRQAGPTSPPIAANPMPIGEDVAPSVDGEEWISAQDVRGLEYSVLERRDPVRMSRFVTDDGEFEQRTIVRWKIYSVYEPRTGERVLWSAPTVSVTVLPLSGSMEPTTR